MKPHNEVENPLFSITLLASGMRTKFTNSSCLSSVCLVTLCNDAQVNKDVSKTKTPYRNLAFIR